MKGTYLRILAYLEGLSFLFLLFCALPWRALTHDPTPVRIAGTLHGLLFLMLIITMLTMASDEKWGRRKTLIGLLSTVLPFGPFWFERRLRIRSD